MKGLLLLASSVAFKDVREKAEKLSCIILCCTNSYLLLRTAQLAVAAALVAEVLLCLVPLALEAGKRSCATATVWPWVCWNKGLPFHWVQLLSPAFNQAHASGGFLKLAVKIGHCRKLLCELLLCDSYYVNSVTLFLDTKTDRVTLQKVDERRRRASCSCRIWSILSSHSFFLINVSDKLIYKVVVKVNVQCTVWIAVKSKHYFFLADLQLLFKC